jgi:putative ABC transport system permease protein
MGGRNFDPQKVSADTVINEFIVNETFLKKFNLSMDEAIGKEIVLGIVSDNGTGKIVGVVEDFHTASMHTKVEPIMLFNDPRFFSAILVRTSAGTDIKSTVKALEDQWKIFSPQRPFNFTFLDDQYDAMYRTEERVGLLVTIFSALAIFIACLGLLGLASFNSMQRSKEIGIRKVLGAKTENIMLLLSNSYVRLMVVAFVIAGPVSYYLMNLWLANFAYQIQIDPWYFVIGALTVGIVAIGTVSYQSFRASVVNPVDSLKMD